MERLDKLLAATGRWSRREIKEMVRRGRILYDGAAVRDPGEKFPENAAFQVDGEKISCAPHCYLMLHKPGGILSATEDSRQPTVLDLLPEHLRRIGLFPVGRLDKDTEGLLLLTNDGAAAHALLSPRHHVDKVYFVQVDGLLTREDEAAFAEGMLLQSGVQFRPAELQILPQADTALVTLREGKFHQIKRMLAARGRQVLYLKRLAMGPLKLDPELAPGTYRELTCEERSELLLLVNIPK